MTDPREQFERMARQLPIGRDPASVRQRLEAMEMLLERAFTVPGTNYRVGLDAVVGLVPVLGDLITTAMGAWLVWEARNLGMSKFHLLRMGGAQNHRMGLWDAAMIKDNHVAVAGGVAEAVRRAVAAGIARIIVEVDRVDQIEEALAAGATHLLLDNMEPPVLREAVALVGGRVPTEASGGVTLETIRAKAETGVTYISVGRLTQSAPAADIGLDFASA